MGCKYSSFLFNTIAPLYGLIFKAQMRNFTRILNNTADELDLTAYQSVLDVGCGTGALTAVLSARGLSVTGVEPAEKMLGVAMRKPENEAVTFLHTSILEKLPFPDKHFDVSIASYVAHGLQPDERKQMYAEMSRVSRCKVIIHDYNQKRNLITTLVEWLEQGDYFGFIKTTDGEMRDCVHHMQECFSEVRVIDIGDRAAWYVCTPF